MNTNDFGMDDSFASFVQELEKQSNPKPAALTTQNVRLAEAKSHL